MKRLLLRRFLIVALLLGIYPACVIGYTWTCVLQSDFEGGKRGPLDAYRHALASAVVSYTLGDWAVDFTTSVCESPDSESGKMDIHNNRLGAAIGSQASSFQEIEPAIRQAVLEGGVLSDDPEQIYWLPQDTWGKNKLW
ncbi:DUF6973 domain-containing protein [Lignipirellula cremea]|uniref:DUF6973 domain-containing protein n=1 Tax=Lignipirellula cremea TaxID=2528010 RepID=A0A518E0V6_9BACT|nr:hypothetical protein [Lignipirellula cremea]QDU97719.1 hypothetical protein Pla8534_55730 [Lignipirellula cremea]